MTPTAAPVDARGHSQKSSSIDVVGAEGENVKVKEYEAFVAERAFMPLLPNDDSYSVIGLCGEAGEVAEWVKKAQFRKNPKFTEAMLKSELGDVLHYVTRMALNHGWSLKDIMEDNVDKLLERKAALQEIK